MKTSLFRLAIDRELSMRELATITTVSAPTWKARIEAGGVWATAFYKVNGQYKTTLRLIRKAQDELVRELVS